MMMLSKEILDTIRAKADAYDALCTPERVDAVIVTVRALEITRELIKLVSALLDPDNATLSPEWRQKLVDLLEKANSL